MNQDELVHIMLKPTTFKYSLRDSVLEDLIAIGGQFILSKKLVLNHEQILEIYPNFDNPRAQSTVFEYLTTNFTEHFAFRGQKGIHKKYQESKGKPGVDGIRGKYYTNYTKLSPRELWLSGRGENIKNIDLEMCGYNILHIPDSPEESRRGLIAVFGNNNLLNLN
jgi:hypothetical protein